jgi:hypothetical protein
LKGGPVCLTCQAIVLAWFIYITRDFILIITSSQGGKQKTTRIKSGSGGCVSLIVNNQYFKKDHALWVQHGHITG